MRREGPLAILTRPPGQSRPLAAHLGGLGWEVADWPALEIATRPATDLPRLEDFELVVFVSGNAVRHFARQREALAMGEWPARVPVATVGPVSAAACPALGSAVSVIHPPVDSVSFDSEALWRELQRRGIQPQRVLIVRGGEGPEGSGRGWLAAQWRGQGAQVVLHAAYTRRPVVWSPERQTELLHWQGRREIAWLWSSGEAIAAVAAQWGERALARAWQGARLIVTHPRVAEVAGELALRGGLTLADRSENTGASLVIQVCLPQEDAVLAAFVN